MITAIITTYKSPDMLDVCLRSALQGRDSKLTEIIVVVDGTEEHNREVIEKYRNKVNFLILPDNGGLCNAMNMATYNASNPYILHVQDDNIFPLNWDSEITKYFDNGKELIISPNQIEPYDSIFPDFHIKDLGRDPIGFDLDNFWNYEQTLRSNKVNDHGFTLPFAMSKEKYIMLNGWDTNYPLGLVADWDFFLRCSMVNITPLRIFDVHFYHFVSGSTARTEEQKRNRAIQEQLAHEYAYYKWSKRILHNPENYHKYLG